MRGPLAVVAVDTVVVAVVLQVQTSVSVLWMSVGVACVGFFVPTLALLYLHFLRPLKLLPNLELANMLAWVAWANFYPSPYLHQDPVPDQYPVVCRTLLEMFPGSGMLFLRHLLVAVNLVLQLLPS